MAAAVAWQQHCIRQRCQHRGDGRRRSGPACAAGMHICVRGAEQEGGEQDLAGGQSKHGIRRHATSGWLKAPMKLTFF